VRYKLEFCACEHPARVYQEPDRIASKKRLSSLQVHRLDSCDNAVPVCRPGCCGVSSPADELGLFGIQLVCSSHLHTLTAAMHVSAVDGEQTLERACSGFLNEWNSPRCPLADVRIDRLFARMGICGVDMKNVLMICPHLAA
jgi:hypothetical protein